MKDGEIMKEKNIVFMGTPDFAVPILKYLIDILLTSRLF